MVNYWLKAFFSLTYCVVDIIEDTALKTVAKGYQNSYRFATAKQSNPLKHTRPQE
jgi:hypothetical protein